MACITLIDCTSRVRFPFVSVTPSTPLTGRFSCGSASPTKMDPLQRWPSFWSYTSSRPAAAVTVYRVCALNLPRR